MSPSSGVPVDENDRLPAAVVLVVDLDVVVVLCTDCDVRHLCSFLSSWSGRLNRPGAAFRRIGACADCCEDSAGSRASLRPWRVDYHQARRSAVLERRQQRNSPGDLCLNTEGQPSDLPAYVFRRPRELTLDRFSSLLEVLPALVVDGDGNARSDEATQLDLIFRRQRVAHGPVTGNCTPPRWRSGTSTCR